MNKLISTASLALIISTSLIGCSTLHTKPQSQTLYLDDYSKLVKVDTRNGSQALVWKNPDIKMQNYKTLSFQPISYYNGVVSNENVSQVALDNVLSYTNSQVKNELAKRYTINTSHADLEFRGVITKMDASTKDMKIYEALPFMMVYSGAKYLAGKRELNTHIIFEGQFIDKKTNQPVLKYVQSIEGEELKDKKDQITIEDVKKAIDLFAQDLAYIAQ